MRQINLSEYCDSKTYTEAVDLLHSQGISQMSQSQLSDGTWRLQGKAEDYLTFYYYPWVRLDKRNGRILGHGCTCQEGGGLLCAHRAALVMAFEQPSTPPAPSLDDSDLEDIPIDNYTVRMPDYEMPDMRLWLLADLFDPTKPTPESDPVPESKPEPKPEPKPKSKPEPKPKPVPAPPPEEPEEPEEPDWEPEEPEEPEKTAPAPILPSGGKSMQILFGNTLEDGAPVLWLPNDTERVFHTNLGIIGTMGTGKTQLTKSVVTQLYRAQGDNFNGQGLGILIFDYKGDYNETKTDFVQAVNARVLKPYRLPYNPLALNRAKSFRPLLPMRTANEFKDTIAKIFRLGVKQQQVLLECIVKAYAKQGIDPENPGTWNRRAPTFDQVYRIFEEDTVGRQVDSLTAAMKKIHQFRLFEGDPRKAVSLGQLLKGVVVIDLSGYDRDIQNLIVAITLDHFYTFMHKTGSSATDGRYRQQRYFLLVDEADSFMSQDFPSLRKIMKEGREFGVGMILSTQSLSHFVGGDDDYSRYVLTWVVHNVNDLKQRDVEYVFKLQSKSPDILRQYAIIKGLSKHESVVKLANDQPLSIRDKAFWQLCKEL